jgi:hypothetical protein
MHPTEAYFPTIAGVIATLVVALAFGWDPPRQNEFGLRGLLYFISLFFIVPGGLFVALDGMTKDPILSDEAAFYVTLAVAWLLLIAVGEALIKRALNKLEPDQDQRSGRPPAA